MFRRFLPALAAPALLLALCASVAAQTFGPFNVTFVSAGQSFSFRGQTYTAARTWDPAGIQDVAAAIQTWSNTIANPYGPRPINVYVVWDTSIGPSALARSNNAFVLSGTTAYTNAEYVWRQGAWQGPAPTIDVVWAFDPNPSGSFNNWYFGGGAVPSNRLDFLSTAAHEAGHTLGFNSCYYNSQTGYPQDDQWYLWQPGPPATLVPAVTTWDGWLRDAISGGNQPAPGSTGTPGNFNETANPCYWAGPWAWGLYLQTRFPWQAPYSLPIYAPATLQPGASLTHVDNSLPNALMDAQSNWGTNPPAAERPGMGDDGGHGLACQQGLDQRRAGPALGR